MEVTGKVMAGDDTELVGQISLGLLEEEQYGGDTGALEPGQFDQLY